MVFPNLEAASSKDLSRRIPGRAAPVMTQVMGLKLNCAEGQDGDSVSWVLEFDPDGHEKPRSQLSTHAHTDSGC